MPLHTTEHAELYQGLNTNARAWRLGYWTIFVDVVVDIVVVVVGVRGGDVGVCVFFFTFDGDLVIS